MNLPASANPEWFYPDGCGCTRPCDLCGGNGSLAECLYHNEAFQIERCGRKPVGEPG